MENRTIDIETQLGNGNFITFPFTFDLYDYIENYLNEDFLYAWSKELIGQELDDLDDPVILDRLVRAVIEAYDRADEHRGPISDLEAEIYDTINTHVEDSYYDKIRSEAEAYNMEDHYNWDLDIDDARWGR